jgi:hypothetical protein
MLSEQLTAAEADELAEHVRDRDAFLEQVAAKLADTDPEDTPVFLTGRAGGGEVKVGPTPQELEERLAQRRQWRDEIAADEKPRMTHRTRVPSRRPRSERRPARRRTRTGVGSRASPRREEPEPHLARSGA